jgi:hypothetical protein
MTGHLFHITPRPPGVSLRKAKSVISVRLVSEVEQSDTTNAALIEMNRPFLCLPFPNHAF